MSEASVEFDYRAIDVLFGAESEEENIVARFVDFQIRVFEWIDRGNGALAKCVRMQAVKLFLTSGKNQTKLGKQIGVGKAAVSKAVKLFREEFNLKELIAKTPKMRNDDTRKKLSEICTKRHQASLLKKILDRENFLQLCKTKQSQSQISNSK